VKEVDFVPFLYRRTGILAFSALLAVSQENPENSFPVVKVFSSKARAEQEVSRLNGINSAKGCRYVLHPTRLEPSLN
jgi:hypothetical protein